ncbi:hypothetical protein SAMN04487898_105129 [Pedobacter sp. ok626]|uniref:hypothetical protein n=1 Tax=Pedobacter sp. ok626 TaxID=1761882 RepID=UPI0008854C4A|nr:hypothetical protein [Pedobacter sp. ok626]SDJ94949.1 hypothetical protein SAMN04487898_105129 [Pedobacter sp. ok626]
MQAIKINTYVNTFTPNVAGTITIEQCFKNIQSPSEDHKAKIIEARKLKLQFFSTKNEVIKAAIKKEYEKIKLPLPSVSYNGIFNSYRENKNYTCGTGLLYIDVDSTGFIPETLDRNKIFSYYKSVGGLGYSILVKVNDLTIENFNSTYQYVVNDLGIENIYDVDAKKISQQSIISFDPNIFINNNSFVYSSINEEKLDNIEKYPTGHINIKKGKHNVTDGVKNILKYNNLDDFDFNGNDYIEDWYNGLQYVYCTRPFQLLTDGRKRYMITYIRNLVWLNPTASRCQILNSAKFVNLSISNEPLPNIIIEKQVDSIFKQLKDGTLEPKVKIRKIIFNPKCLLTKDEKHKVRCERQSIYYSDVSTGKIYNIIEDWNFEFNGKITIATVTDISKLDAETKLNKKTVEKRWGKIKEYIKSLNEASKDEIKRFKDLKSKTGKSPDDEDLTQLMTDMDVVTITEQSMIESPEYIYDDEDLEFINLH